MANYINNLGQIRLGWRSPVVSNQPTISASLLQSLYGVWNGDTTTNELDKSLFGVWNKGDNNSTVKNAWNANGNFIDSKGGANGVVATPSGTTFVSGTMSFGTGKLGSGAFSFSGSNFISLPNGTLNFTSDFSLSFWIYVPTSFGTNYSRVLTAFDNSDGWNTYRGWDTTYSNGNMHFTIYNGIGTDYYSISVPMTLKDQWVHFSITKVIGQQGNIYINGVAGVKTVSQRGSGASSNTISYKGSNHLAYIGADYYAFSLPYYTPTPAGGFKIDSIQTWDGVALDATAVSELYNSGIGQEYPFTISNAPIGTTKDSFGTNHGTLQGGTTYTTGKIGSAFTFDGVNDYVALPDNIFNFTGDFSASAWVYLPTNTKSNIGIFGNYNFATGTGWGISSNSTGNLYARIGNSGGNYATSATSKITINGWTHVVMVFKKGTGFYAYTNGELVAQFTLANNSNAGTTPLYSATQKAYIGLLNYSGDWWWMPNGGKIDAFNVWQRSISQDEITQLYNSGTGAQYPFTGTFSSAGNQLGVDNGTLMNGCYLSDGKIGKAFTFDGVNDYIDLPNNSMNFTGDFSVSGWINQSSIKSYHMIIGNQGTSTGNWHGWLVWVLNNKLTFDLYNGNSAVASGRWQTTTTLSTNTWIHFTITKKPGQAVKIYLDGVIDGGLLFGSNSANVTYTTTNYATIGLNKYSNPIVSSDAGYWHGKIDSLNVYQKELTQAEVTELYNSGNGKQITATPIVQTGLILNLDASRKSSYTGTGTTWADISGNSNNGTLVNGPIFGTANGGVMNFDGVNDYVNLGTSTNLKFTKNFTINMWVNFNSKSGIQTLISCNESGGYGIISNYNLEGFVGTAANRIVTFYYINGNYYLVGDNLNNYNVNTWYNISVTYDGNTIKYYRNATLIESYNIVGSVTTTAEPLSIGSNPNSAGSNFSDFFNGNIGQTMIYNRVLSDTEILQNFNATKTRFGL